MGTGKRPTAAEEGTRQAALLMIAQLAVESLRMIPLERNFDRSADRLLEDPVPITELVGGLSAQERERLVATYRELFPDALAALAPQCGDETKVNEAILLGALIAGVNDRHAGALAEMPELLDLIEERAQPGTDPVEVLAFVLDGTRLWDDRDGRAADRALAALPGWLDEEEWEERWDAILEDVARRRYRDWHERRLGRMVEEVRDQLPLPTHAVASVALAEGCARFAADPGLGRRISARLLADVLPLPVRAETERRAA